MRREIRRRRGLSAGSGPNDEKPPEGVAAHNVLCHDIDGVTDLGYDAAGNLKGVRQTADGKDDGATTTTYQYTYLNGSWQQSAAVTRRGGDVESTVTQRDANGFVVGIRQPKSLGAWQQPQAEDVRYDRTFVNDANGTAVFVSQGGYNDIGEVKSSIANPASGCQGGVTGSALTPGHVQRQLVANGEVLARYGDAPTQEENTPQTNTPAYVDTADFRLQAAQIRPRHKSMDPIAYSVVGGETLKNIARNVLGDASANSVETFQPTTRAKDGGHGSGAECRRDCVHERSDMVLHVLWPWRSACFTLLRS